jgi:ATP-dependent RNA helicase RhlE
MSQDIKTFSDFKLNKQLLTAVEEAGYNEPTEIQQKAIPLLLAGHDLLGIAPTGTGKTAAYVLPMLMKIKYAQGNAPRALILAPTRELVLQIEEVVRQFSTYTDLRCMPLIGGKGVMAQAELVMEGIDILVATPGRFLDVYRTGNLVTSQIKTLVMDEADKMMDMGFMHQINSILEVIPVKRQNALFSATMSDKVVSLSEDFLEYAERVEVSPQATTAETVKQLLYEVPNFKTKLNLLLYLLSDEDRFNRVIVFTKTKKTADDISKYLMRKLRGEVRVIHANKGQNTRINAMEAFKEGGVNVLVATDVAARGIDVTMVSHVINFDVPLIYEDYVHRIGRTGRARQSGEAITFMNPAEEYHIGKIEELIRQPIPRAPLPQDLTIEKTPFEEQQQIAREIDEQKRKEDPNFKGAFHEKKRLFKGPQGKVTFKDQQRTKKQMEASKKKGPKGRRGGNRGAKGRRKLS